MKLLMRSKIMLIMKSQNLNYLGLEPSANLMHLAGKPAQTSPAGTFVHFGTTALEAITAPSPIVQPG